MSTTRATSNANEIATTVSMQTGASLDQRIPENIAHVNEQVTLGFNSFLFTLLSNIKGIGSLIASTAQYLFPFAFALKANDWFLYAWKYLKSSNKNAGKTNNLLLKTVTTTLIGLVVFGSAFIATSLSHLLFASIMVIDVAVGFAKSIYFGISAINKPKHERNFYLDQLKQNAIKTVVGGLLLSALVVTLIYGSPAIASAAVAGMGIAAGLTLAFFGVMGVVNYFRKRRANKALQKEIAYETRNQNSPRPRSRIAASNTIKNKPAKLVEYNEPFKLSKNGFYGNRIALLKPLSNNYAAELHDLKVAIQRHEKRLEKHINKAANGFIENYVWSQGNKRTKKIGSLQFLNHFINQFDNILSGLNDRKEVTINGKSFNDYQNIDSLIQKIDHHITSHFPSAYQSFFADVGNVEALFKQAYKLLAAKAMNGMTQSATAQNVINTISNRL